MKLFYLLVILLFGFHAYVIDREPQHAIEKKEFSEPEGIVLTAEDFERGDKLVLEPPDKNAPFPFENGDVVDPEENAILKKRNSKRNAVLTKLWPNKTVPYLVTYGFWDNETALIARAISEFRRKTCVRWTARNGETDFVFFGKSNTCESEVGRQGGCQLIKMKPNRCFHFTTLLHEMMHTLGFTHEHQRHDRDDYVKINYTNLIMTDAVRSDLTNIASDTTDVGDYDYHSIMHYDPYVFSKNGLPTMVPVPQTEINNRYPEHVIHVYNSLSEWDAYKINHVYECQPCSYSMNGPLWNDDVDNATECTARGRPFPPRN